MLIDLDAMARRMHVEVIYRPITRLNGMWLPKHRVIVVREGMRRPHTRSVYAHELAHAAFEHTGWAPGRGKEEAQADRHAADTLIDESAVVAAARRGNHHVNELARELCVTPQLLKVWMSHHFPS